MSLIPFLLLLITASLIPGIIAITKAKFSGRKGVTLFQPIYDIIRLLRKGSVYSTTTSYIFQWTPTIYFGGVVAALLFIPFNGQAGLLSFEGDFVFFAYLLGLSKFMLILNAMDTGSGFEGMGANREALYSMLVEPAFFTMMGALALLTGHSSFADIYQNVHVSTSLSILLAGICVYLLVQIAMVENSRLPVDDPRTHLELTMIHEVMVLDNSGFDFGLIMTANAFKFAMYAGLISNFVESSIFPFWANVGIFIGIGVAFGVVVGWLESFRARNKIAHNPQFILTLSSVALLLFFVVLVLTNKFVLQ